MPPFAQENFISAQRIDAPELAAPGSYRIGVRTIELINPGQYDFANASENGTIPVYDRPLTVEVWYPAVVDDRQARGEYLVSTRDPEVQAILSGLAIRDAEPDKSDAAYPLIVISHGNPGNRFLLSHLAENLATKGYIVAAIDHTDSTYTDQNVFSSTLYNRPLDQHFVIESVIGMSDDDSSFLSGIVDADNVGLIGYSMGGYGALIASGGAVTGEIAASPYVVPGGMLADHQANKEAYQTMLAKSRIKAAVAFAPWGMNVGMWSPETLAEIKIPFFFIAGSQDDVSGYESGTRAIWENTVNCNRYLLTYENARHNAGAPIAAPVEVTDYDYYMHYADSVWDNIRMNNIAQHFVTAYCGIHLKGEDYGRYLDLIPNAIDGVYEVDDAGNFREIHNYWAGFQDRSAIGLRLEYLEAGSRAFKEISRN